MRRCRSAPIEIGGGYALDASYALPPVNFAAREAALLVALGKHASEMRLLPFVETLDSALDKARSALPKSAQRELLGVLERLSFLGVPRFRREKTSASRSSARGSSSDRSESRTSTRIRSRAFATCAFTES